jgi:hypothetical protein
MHIDVSFLHRSFPTEPGCQWESLIINPGIKNLIKCYRLIPTDCVSCALNSCKGEALQLPDHAADLVFVGVGTWNPPFPPCSPHGDVKLLFHFCDPLFGTDGGDRTVQVSAVNELY